MTQFRMRFVAAAMVAAMTVPALAQISHSDGFAFLKAVRERDGAKVTAAVLQPGSNIINHRDVGSGDGALHILVRARDLTYLNYLLARGARPDLQNNDGDTPLLLAAQIGWVAGAEQLLARRASPNLANGRGETPLILAVQGQHLPMVRLLIGHGADPNHTDSLQGYSAIDYARQDRRFAAILRVLEAPRSTPTPAPTAATGN